MALVETHIDGGVLTVTLADEENRNALSSALVGELITALDAADA
ncbi:MAG TPA: enoyl-CoA hydratase, partial [Acidimicrobiia bacterium]|nr:enoyl-CoA hydratase [Acidimicrobiia bacterium]